MAEHVTICQIYQKSPQNVYDSKSYSVSLGFNTNAKKDTIPLPGSAGLPQLESLTAASIPPASCVILKVGLIIINGNLLFTKLQSIIY